MTTKIDKPKRLMAGTYQRKLQELEALRNAEIERLKAVIDATKKQRSDLIAKREAIETRIVELDEQLYDDQQQLDNLLDEEDDDSE